MEQQLNNKPAKDYGNIRQTITEYLKRNCVCCYSANGIDVAYKIQANKLKTVEELGKGAYFGYVYLLKNNGFIKIGCTTTPFRRYKTLSHMFTNYCVSNVSRDVIITVPHTNYYKNENSLHRIHSDKRYERSENFAEDERNIIESLKKLEYLDESKEIEEENNRFFVNAKNFTVHGSLSSRIKRFINNCQVYGNKIEYDIDSFCNVICRSLDDVITDVDSLKNIDLSMMIRGEFASFDLLKLYIEHFVNDNFALLQEFERARHFILEHKNCFKRKILPVERVIQRVDFIRDELNLKGKDAYFLFKKWLEINIDAAMTVNSLEARKYPYIDTDIILHELGFESENQFFEKAKEKKLIKDVYVQRVHSYVLTCRGVVYGQNCVNNNLISSRPMWSVSSIDELKKILGK